MNFIDLFSIQSVVTVYIFLFFECLELNNSNVALHFLYMVTVSFVYTMYKVYISLQHFVLILRKVFYHRKYQTEKI